MEMLESKSDTQSIDSNNSKMNKIFQNDDIQKAIDQVNYINIIVIYLRVPFNFHIGISR